MAKFRCFISLEKDRIQIEWSGLAEAIEPEVIPFMAGFEDTSFFLNLFLDASKRILMNHLPVDEVVVEIDETINRYGYLQSAAQSLQNTLKRTNELLQKLSGKRNFARNFNRSLYYSADDHPDLKQLYSEAEDLKKGASIYKSFLTGWNKNLRRWEPSQSFSIEELIDFIEREHIHRIVTLNMYYLKHCLRDAVFALAVFKFIGVNYIMIDLDVYDLQWNFAKSVFNDERIPRYSMFPEMSEPWDEAYKTINIQYIPCSLSLPASQGPIKLKPNFDIVIASHSRVPDLISQLNYVLYTIEEIPDENLYDDFQLWYYSFRHWILENETLSLFEKEYTNSVLYTLYLNGITFLKYETLERVSEFRRPKLYGDQAWSKIFPEYFQGHYLENFGETFSNGQALNLLLNVNFSYLEVNPVVHRVLAQRTPFLTFPPLVRLPELESMKAFEYRNPGDLSKKIEHISASIDRDEAASARRYLQDILGEVHQSILRSTMGEYDAPGLDRFKAECQKHSDLARERTTSYIAKNQALIREQFSCLFRGAPLPNAKELAQKSRFRDRKYLRRLLEV